MINNIEDKSKKELVEIVKIQMEEYQKAVKDSHEQSRTIVKFHNCIAGLEKERDEANCHAYYILDTCMVFSPAHFEAHNLEQQAKGARKASELKLKEDETWDYASQFVEDLANELSNQAKALRESK